jgi:hypothetical protein
VVASEVKSLAVQTAPSAASEMFCEISSVARFCEATKFAAVEAATTRAAEQTAEVVLRASEGVRNSVADLRAHVEQFLNRVAA